MGLKNQYLKWLIFVLYQKGDSMYRFRVLKLLLSIFIFLSLKTVQGQLFSINMNFQDAAGNRDTLILGYDSNASDTIDTFFNEMNILSTSFDTGLDVRVGNL